ncbi:MAG: hypothetical protein J0L88_14580 [Xanthomonadales bacterium]|nr:hypothetical protein [Xanthomonadales bacterium]
MKAWMMAVAIACVPLGAIAAEPQGERIVTLQWELALDADGHVIALASKNRSYDALRERLEPVVRGWDFEPGRIDGRPAPTDTMLSVQVTLVPQADGKAFGVKLRDVRTGGSIAPAGNVAPRMTARELERMVRSRERSAMVVIEARYDGDGKPIEVAAVPGATRAPKGLVDASVVAIRQWTFEPERVGGIGVPGRVVTPICFAIGTRPAETSRALEGCARWTPPGSTASLGEGETLAFDSRVRLKSDPFAAAL